MSAIGKSSRKDDEQRLIDYAKKRELIDIAERISAQGYSNADIQDIARELDSALNVISSETTKDIDMTQEIANAIDDMLSTDP
jgi:hypothetical protein